MGGAITGSYPPPTACAAAVTVRYRRPRLPAGAGLGTRGRPSVDRVRVLHLPLGERLHMAKNRPSLPAGGCFAADLALATTPAGAFGEDLSFPG